MRTDVQKGIDCGNRIRQTNHKLAHCADGPLRAAPKNQDISCDPNRSTRRSGACSLVA